MGTTSTCFPTAYLSNPTGIVAGADGNLWFRDGDSTIGRISTAGTITTFPIPISSGYVSLIVNPSDIATGPDGNVWFTELGDNQIGRITPSGTITEFSVPTASAHPTGIAAGPDGNLWFSEVDANQIGRITSTGTISEFPVTTPNSGPGAITAGPDGNVWFAERNANQIGRITPSGRVSEFPSPSSGSPSSITAGADGDLWFTESNKVDRVTPAGIITENSVPADVGAITSGPDGNLWMVETQADVRSVPAANLVARMPAALIPSEISPPAISGFARQGETLSEYHGSWTNSPSGYTYQWERCTTGLSGLACNPIPGARSANYALSESDIGFQIRVQETATTTGGGVGGPTPSSATSVVRGSPPVNVAPPSASGAPIQGVTLSEVHGSWMNHPTDYGYQWEDCAASGGGCIAIGEATTQSYRVRTADVGHTIRVQESAKNPAGSSPWASSAATRVVQPAHAKATVGRATVRGKSARVHISCTGTPGAMCIEALSLTATELLKRGRVVGVSATRQSGAKRTVHLGSVTVRLLAGRNATGAVNLNSLGLRLLSAHRVLKVTLTVAGGKRTASRQVVTFRR